MRYALIAFAFLAISTSGVAAHAVDADADADASATLRYLQAVVVSMVSLAYACGVYRIRRRVGADRIVTRSQTVAFALAGGLFVFILSPPVDDITDTLFSAHMAQHLVLMLFVAPLAVWSRPIVVGLWAFPSGGRKALSNSPLARGIRAGSACLMHPLLVAASFLGTFSFWHLPRPNAWGLQNEWVHAFEHLTFLVTAIMFWSLVIEPSGRRRMGYSVTLLYVSVIAVLSGLPGALMILSPVALFKADGYASGVWGLTPLEDQQIAGLIMWIPAGIFFLVPIAVLFVKALQSADRHRAAGQTRIVSKTSAGIGF